MTDDRQLSPGVVRMAHELAPSLLERVIRESEEAAAAEMRAELTAALVREMRRTAAPGASGTMAVVEPSGTEASSGWYVYGLTWSELARHMEGARGIDGAPLEVLATGSVAAVTSPVSAAGQWGSTVQGELDLEALAPRAGDHERVLEHLLDLGAVLPLRFGVMYPSLDGVRRMLAAHAPEVQAELQRLAGQCEWGLTIKAKRAPALAAVRDIKATAGRQYLDRRTEERRAQEQQRADRACATEEIHDRLLAVSTDGLLLTPTAPAGDDRDTVMRAAYLVDGRRSDAFRAAAESALSGFPELSLSGDLTGPWPAYHFTDVRFEELPA